MNPLLPASYKIGYKNIDFDPLLFGYRTNEPYPIEPEEPAVVREVVKFYLKQYGYSVAELSKIVGLHEEEFRLVYLNDRPHLRLVERSDKVS